MFQKTLIGFHAKSYTTPLKALLVCMVNMKLNQRQVSLVYTVSRWEHLTQLYT